MFHNYKRCNPTFKTKQNITNSRHLQKNIMNGNINIVYLMICIKSPLKRTVIDLIEIPDTTIN
jgi:hypothetical protein